jgi:ribA/ribD-fused uncharacterized protein
MAIVKVSNDLPQDPVREFQGDFRWLSNFWPAPVVLDGLTYPTVEHAYQAAKSEDPAWRQLVLRTPKPGKVKRSARGVQVRPDWDAARVGIMLDLLRQKFRKGSDLGDQLARTGQRELIEGNTWGDVWWGVSRGQGQNMLGKLLVQVRGEIGPPSPSAAPSTSGTLPGLEGLTPQG